MKRGLLDTSKRREKPNTKVVTMVKEPKQQHQEAKKSSMEEPTIHQQQQQQQQRRRQEAGKFSISELPNVILVNILSRLPFKNIHICKCVCKSWLDIFSDPYFAETHFKFSKTCILAHPFLINMNPKPKNPFVLDWEVPNVLNRHAIIKFDPNAMLSSNNCVMVNSCDGLICLWCPLLCGAFCVCNPISGEYVMIPAKQEWGCHGSMCFGFSPKSNKYKIVQFSGRFDHRHMKMWMVDIFTIGMDNSWRSIEKSVFLGGDPTSTFLNGRVHWVVTDCNNADFIGCFDFDCEGVQSVCAPKEFGADHKKRSNQMKLGLMSDCLYLCDYSVDIYCDIWVMKEYGVQESWAKKFVISAPIIARLKNSYSIKFLDNGECLIFFSNKVLVSDNLKENQFTEVQIGKVGKKIEGKIAYKPSFILLKEIAQRQNWELVDIRKNKW